MVNAKLGDDHSDTLRSMNNLANLNHNQGRYDAAEPLEQVIIVIVIILIVIIIIIFYHIIISKLLYLSVIDFRAFLPLRL